MSQLLEEYYRGITQQLRAEVDFINSLFQHQGLKGEGNEAVLRDLLIKFIPRRFGIGTGVVIDRNGKPSRQCDIVVYDTLLYPSLLSLSHVHIFPVDVVYATIEVKTTLDSETAKNALENIKSVRSLDIIKDSWMTLESTEILKGSPPRRVAAVAGKEYQATPPVGIIFAYNSETQRFETFKDWFMPKTDAEAPNFPTMIGCLDQGIVKFIDISPSVGKKPEAYALPVVLNGTDALLAQKGIKCTTHDGTTYPVKRVKENYLAIDQSRVLLLFLLLVNEFLATKKINPSIKFTKYYLGAATIQNIIV